MSAGLRATLVSRALAGAAYRDKPAAMAAAGVDLTVIVPDRWRVPGGVADPVAVPAVRPPARASAFAVRQCPVALSGHFHAYWYRSLGGLLVEARPEVVHLDEEPYNLATWHGLRAARRVGAATCFFAWQNLARRSPPPLSFIQRRVFALADGAIAGTRAAEQVLRRHGYGGPVWVIPQFGVDEERFHPEPGAGVARPFTVGYAGRLVPEKGVGDLLLALQRMVPTVDGEPWRLRIAGDGPARAPLAALAAGPGGGVEWLGWLAPAELPAFYRSLDVLVLPSRTTRRWAEQFGRVLIEAMACGVACVGTSSGEIGEVLGSAGVIVPERDAGALAHALTELRDDPARRARLGRAGRERVLAHFTTRLVAERTVQVYGTLVRGRPGLGC
jgi:glycosyltransferase involved in cell wall biosynthesis